MELELRYFAMIREAVGERTTTREFDPETTVRDVLATLENDHPDLEGTLLADDGTIARSVTVLRNGTNVTHLERGATELADGDTLSITPPVTGG
jgi:sulfur-carrier protein